MDSQHFDIIEVFLKKDLDIPLTKQEEEWFNNMDDETKKSVFSLVNSCSYIEELVKVMNRIEEKSISLPLEQQQEIIEKCKSKQQNLEKIDLQQFKKKI